MSTATVDLFRFRAVLQQHQLPLPVSEHRFDETRRWRFDYAWPELHVALEVEGGIWTHGRHTRGAGYLADLEKYSTAAAMGWAVIRVTPDQLCTSYTMGLLQRAFSGARKAA